jgi:hypothetical protein
VTSAVFFNACGSPSVFNLLSILKIKKSSNPFVMERVKIPGTHYKISSKDHEATNVGSVPKRPKSGNIFTDKP